MILTASYGEGHNSAARGVRDGLARTSPDAIVDVRDLFAETFGALHHLVRRSYLTLINRWPRAWGYAYRWMDRRQNFDNDFGWLYPTTKKLEELLETFRPDVVVSVYPTYPYLLRKISGSARNYQSVVIVTDSITVNGIWYRSQADYWLVPNEQSIAPIRSGGVAPERIKALGFPVDLTFADFTRERPPLSSATKPRVLYVINAGTAHAPQVVRRLLDLNIQLTVTVGYDERLRRAIEFASGGREIEIVGWTSEMPRLLCTSHLLIGKAGGAIVQESIAASCPMIINHVVSGQEEGNARLIVETNSGAVAHSPDEVAAQVERAFADDAKQWREWSANISRLSRPRASLDIAEFLLSL